MMLASLGPDLFGPIIIAGAPLSYWAGVRGKNPMRYSGGLLGGSWLTALTSDLGGGKFDGAWLVENFESLNPRNALDQTVQRLFEGRYRSDRYLEFERWWGGHVDLNAEEIQFIVDELFIGNKLAAGQIKTSDGAAVDLRNIRSPIVVFCSKGDTSRRRSKRWTGFSIFIMMSMRSGLMARPSSTRSTRPSVILESLSPAALPGRSTGILQQYRPDRSAASRLYEATFEAIRRYRRTDLVPGKWIMRCEERTLDDIRAMGGNAAEDERRFATAAAPRRSISPTIWVHSAVGEGLFKPQVAEG